ncbi:MAG TPA: hypothetical protein VIR54_07275 [Vicinamibacterales bacterium]|jgi:hypothetical protein
MALESSVLQKSAAGEPSDPDLQCRIRAEFESMPGLNLTLAQALRLFNTDAVNCEQALRQLVAAGLLSIDEGLFVLRRRRSRPWRRRDSSGSLTTRGERVRRR